MEMAGTEALRSAAADWSLAGDRQLLELLQNIHQKIMTRCQETNNKLEEMVSALDDASVSLQNVNNRFLSLSSTQFVESRVFDEDSDVAADTDSKKQAAVPPQTSELSSLSLALQTIDKLHEPVTILPDRDSDTDTEDEEMQSTILRPKNMYVDRPLPHIIGSYHWKNKWHAGLVIEESDSDSSTSRPGNKLTDEYSDSELEDGQTDRRAAPGRSYAGSVSSSEPSQRDLSPQRPSQADVAAELARRLGGSKMPEPASRVEDDVTTPVTNKIYKPQQPTSGTIFSDEPPPLDTTQDSDFDTYSNEDDDIFAEINKKAPYSNDSKAQNQSVDIFADVHANESRNVYKNGDQNGMERGYVSDDFSKSPAIDKKPAGAISLFGSNKGTESIGAAILNRNRRKSSTSSEESSQNNSENYDKNVKNNFSGAKAGNNEKVISKEKDQIKPPIKVTTNPENVRPRERDIFDDLFARSEKAQKEAAKSQNFHEPSKKVDLFSDNIFDDIDDIFSSNVVIKKPTKDGKNDESKTKSLFDDVDDLFADISVEKTETKIVNNNTKTKSIFDSDDDLFINKAVEKKSYAESYQNVAQLDKSPKSLDNLDLFSGNTESKKHTIQIAANPESTLVKDDEKFKSIFESDDELFLDKKSSSSKDKIKVKELSSTSSISKKTENTESLISDNNDGDNDNNIFSFIKNPILTNIANDKTTVLETCEVKSQNENTNRIINKNQNKQNNNFENLITEPNPKETKVTDDVLDISSPKLDNGHLSKVNVITVNTKCKQNDRSELKAIFPEEKSVKSSSIFDNDDDEIDNLFGKPTEKSKPFEEHNLKAEKALNLSSDIKTVNNDYATKNLNSSVDTKTTILFDSDNNLKGDLSSKVTKNEIKTKLENQNPSKNDVSQNKNDKPSLVKPKLLEEPVTVSELDLVERDKKENTISPEIQSQNGHATKIVLDNTKTNLDNNKNLEDSILTAPKSMISNESKPDIFSDLFLDQPPPAFEKPKEPKKSKNVNALFDDDSDDEALFFKKNDNFSDEKPEDFSPIKTEPLFAIFHDEPPAIDTDFVQKNDTKFNKPVIEKPEVFDDSPKRSIESSEKLPEATQATTDILDGVRQSKEEEKPKTIGKLKPMNFNINVNTLLPGASPKKQIKINKNCEGNTTESTPESPNEEVKPPLVKSVSFEGDPESPILDNKISKQRAKIQVKRRPSTRRARKEAVRKSIIDLSDETDGSGDRNDDHREDNVVEQKQIEQICTTNEIKTVADEKGSKDAKTIPMEMYKDETDYPKDFLGISDTSEDNQDVANKSEENQDIINEDHYLPPTPLEKAENIANVDDIPVMNKEILNEILQENKKVTKDISKTEVLNINDDDIYIFRDPNLSSSENILNENNSKPQHFVKTLGKLYTYDSNTNENITETTKSNKLEVNTDDTDDLFKDFATKPNQVPKDNLFGETSKTLPKTTKKSLFDDLSDDDDLFGGNKKTKPDKSGTKNPFSNNDSEDELFASKKSSSKIDVIAKPVETKLEKKPEEVKKSLFGDEDDDDDLFGVTKKTSPQSKEKSQPGLSTSIAKEGNKLTEQVFDDPLTLLGGEDEF